MLQYLALKTAQEKSVQRTDDCGAVAVTESTGLGWQTLTSVVDAFRERIKRHHGDAYGFNERL